MSFLIWLSPSKSMRSSVPSSVNPVETTEPHFLSDALQIGKNLASLKEAENADLHRLSPKMAATTTEMHRMWLESYPKGEGVPAALAYTGDAYGGLQAEQWTKATWERAQAHLRIGSGLYGCLRPQDRVLPYRLEMGLTWPMPGGAAGPAAYWKKRISAHLLDAQPGAQVLDLSSGEYGSVLDPRLFSTPPIRCDFREIKAGKPVFVSVFGKRARGSMARHVLESDGSLLDVVDAFQTDGYALNPELSTPTLRVFTR
jgi:cytoplasmic iron level regulating protein YaaA (DUF328/UPF0246 family)